MEAEVIEGLVFGAILLGAIGVFLVVRKNRKRGSGPLTGGGKQHGKRK
jgi:hypothetical protein